MRLKLIVAVMACFLLAINVFSHPLDTMGRQMPGYTTLLATKTNYGDLYVLDVEGMHWQGIQWKHRTAILVPKKIDLPGYALVILGGGDRFTAKDLTEKIMKDAGKVVWVAGMLRAPIVVVDDIPNQPIWGFREDALISETFKRFLENPDPTLPALIPMTWGARRALDAIQDFLGKKGIDVEYFMVGGGSKRGWTTYLTAIFDPRVFAIAPMVYDNLNIELQMKHQLEMYGTFSEKLRDYVERGLMEEIGKGEAEELLKLVDPYNFRMRLSLPKILVLAANDEYWTVDSANLYIDDLPGKTWLFYMPNTGHHFDRNFPMLMQVAQTISAFMYLYPKGKFPNVKFFEKDGKLCTSKQEGLEKVELWMAESEDLDFRDEKWRRVEGFEEGGLMCVSTPQASELNIAYFPRALFKIDGKTFYLSGRMRLIKKSR